MSSLEEAWGDILNNGGKISNIVSAKQSSDDDEEVAYKPIKPLANEELLKHFQSLLLEIHELRREQARRCSVYMIMIGILFGIMIMYIDKLNTNVSKQYVSRPFAL